MTSYAPVRRSLWLPVGLLAALLLCAMGVVASLSSPPSGAPAYTPTPEYAVATPRMPNVSVVPEADPCTSPVGTPRYYTDSFVKESPGAFGADGRQDGRWMTAGHDPVDPVGEFRRRNCGDWWVAGDRSLLSVVKAQVDGGDPNQHMDYPAWQIAVADFDRRILWERSVVVTAPATRVTTFYMSHVYGSADPPVVHQHVMDETQSDYLVLYVRKHDGTVVALGLRLKCGFQPVTSAAINWRDLGDQENARLRRLDAATG